jgi:hypothetical protein
MLPSKTLLIAAAALSVGGASALAQDSQSKKPENPAAMSGCPGRMGMGITGMHGMMGADGRGPGMMNAMPMGMGMMRPGDGGHTGDGGRPADRPQG